MEDIRSSKSKFVIIGAGGLGRELQSWVSHSSNFSEKLLLQGYLDDNKGALDGFANQYTILGSISDRNIKKYKNCLMGIANPGIKKDLVSKIISLGSSILSFKHSSCLIGDNNIINRGVVLCPNVIITCNVKIGESVFLNLGSQVGHDAQIGDFTSIMANVDVGGGAVIGDEVFIGSNAVVLPGVKIPDKVIIGAGAVVVKSIKEIGTYFGNPAKRIF